MPTLNIDLQDGFDNDTVIICINGEEVFNQGAITTNQMLGFAEQFTTACHGERVLVTVKVISRNLERRLDIPLDNIAGLGISIINGEIFIRQSDTPFAYA